MRPIADLHSDLLSFLVDRPESTFTSPESNASHSQMMKGGIVFQALAIFTETASDSFIKERSKWRCSKDCLQNTAIALRF